MLITLKSNIFNDPTNPGTGSEDNLNQANQFTNYFPGSLILKKNSSVALLNCTYNIKESYIIPPGGANLILYLPPDNNPNTYTVLAGSYTGPELATAIQAALRINTRPSLISSARAWPNTGFYCSFDPDKSTFNIDLDWDPVGFPLTIVSTQTIATANAGGALLGGAVRKNLGADDPAAEALWYKTSILENFFSATLVSQAGGLDYLANGLGLKWSGAGAHIPFYAAYEWQLPVSQPQLRARIAFSHKDLTSIENANIQLAYNGSGGGGQTSVVVYERTATGTTLLNWAGAGTQTIGPDEKIRILLPAQYTGGPSNAIYQKFGDDWETMELATQPRYNINPEDKVYFRAAIQTPAQINKIPISSNITTKVNGINANGLLYPTPGTNYFLGEKVLIQAGGARIQATAYVDAIDANGGIARLVMEEIGQNYATTDNSLQVTGVESGQSDARIDVNSLLPHTVIATGGLLYAQDDIVEATTDDANGLQIKVLEVNAGGAIVRFDVIRASINPYTPGTSLFFNNPGNPTLAQISFRGVRNIFPCIKNLRFNGYVRHATGSQNNISNPLGLHQAASLDSSTLGPFIGLTGTTPAVPVNDYKNASIKPASVHTKPQNRIANNFLVHLDSFPITSYHKNGQGRCISALPYGDGTKHGLFHDRAYNLTYHSLENKNDENHNEMRVRITDAEGNLLQGLQHPTVLNLDIRPTAL